jgi:gluconate kinase
MTGDLLTSQFKTLEKPDGFLMVQIDKLPEEIINQVMLNINKIINNNKL